MRKAATVPSGSFVECLKIRYVRCPLPNADYASVPPRISFVCCVYAIYLRFCHSTDMQHANTSSSQCEMSPRCRHVRTARGGRVKGVAGTTVHSSFSSTYTFSSLWSPRAIYVAQLSNARSPCPWQCVDGTQSQLYTPARRQVGAHSRRRCSPRAVRGRSGVAHQIVGIMPSPLRARVTAAAQTTCTNVSHCRSCACATRRHNGGHRRRRPRGHLDG